MDTLNGQHVVVAMSGGVDSSVAAAILQDRGAKVTGLYLHLPKPDDAEGGCSSATHAADARAVCERLGIALHERDLRETFAPIIDYFAAAYAAGRTPNPCLHCNRRIKFASICALADEHGADFVATGHHARVIRTDAMAALHRARGRQKDQTYALFALSREQVARLVLPVGELPDKAAVRDIAARIGLAVHDKPDSQEVCFLGGSDFAPLLAQRCPQALRPGDIVDLDGKVLGRHDGYGRYTIGQRRGLGVAAGEPMYVVDIDPARARVTIGPAEAVRCHALQASGANWHADAPEQFEAIVQIRYNHRGQNGTVRRIGPDGFRVDFDEPVNAVTPGQAAVVYDGDRLLGGGWIETGPLWDGQSPVETSA